MSDAQIAAVVTVFAVIALTFVSANRQWLRGWTARIAYALAGGGIIVILWYVDMPPDWFDGSRDSFLLAAFMMVAAIPWTDRAERTFRRPFLLSFGAALLVANLWAHV